MTPDIVSEEASGPSRVDFLIAGHQGIRKPCNEVNGDDLEGVGGDPVWGERALRFRREDFGGLAFAAPVDVLVDVFRYPWPPVIPCDQLLRLVPPRMSSYPRVMMDFENFPPHFFVMNDDQAIPKVPQRSRVIRGIGLQHGLARPVLQGSTQDSCDRSISRSCVGCPEPVTLGCCKTFGETRSRKRRPQSYVRRIFKPVQWLRNRGEVPDKFPVEVAEPEERLGFFDRSWRRPISYGFQLLGVHLHFALPYYDA
ncbi:hypothetical protein LshimejAT787_0208460 [Lyophyllum shimeji]|uniref:Uncharacterized protein n=1 Tax=Lyophyllum shimeji TaxID=47721 RepID=A0A9P3PGW9_LYOSH|nr:hypothetical protein LshimejAT787_0208460 [Lyophyllum shimeji]